MRLRRLFGFFDTFLEGIQSFVYRGRRVDSAVGFDDIIGNFVGWSMIDGNDPLDRFYALSRKYSELRIGQMVWLASHDTDLFFIPDEELIENLEKELDEQKESAERRGI